MTNAQHTHTPGQLKVRQANSRAPFELRGAGDTFTGTPFGAYCATVEKRDDADLLAASFNSYRKHFGHNAIAAAEGDLLGEALAALEAQHKLETSRVVTRERAAEVAEMRRALLAKAGRS